jgi:hypothetical protein
MNEKQGWLQKVLDDASADVKSWPKWLRDAETCNESHNGARDEAAKASGDRQTEKDQRLD